MSKCDLRVELQNNGPIRAGDTIHGVLHADVDSPVRCDGLTVSLGWRTHGRGNTDRGTVDSAQLFAGQWAVGQHRYPFSFSLPYGPLTYRGELVNIDWQVKARADIPWAFDPKAEADFVVERGSTPQHIQPMPAGAARMLQMAPVMQGVIKSIFGLFLSFFGLPFAGAGLMATLDGVWFAALFIVIGLGVSGFGLFMMVKAVRELLLTRRFETLEIKAANTHLLPGEETEVTVTLGVRSAVDIEVVELALLRRERAVSGSGTNTTTHTRNDEFQREHLLDRLHLRPGQPTQRVARLRIPAEAEPSFSAGSNSVLWMVALEVTVPGWPTLTREVPLQVR